MPAPAVTTAPPILTSPYYAKRLRVLAFVANALLRVAPWQEGSWKKLLKKNEFAGTSTGRYVRMRQMDGAWQSWFEVEDGTGQQWWARADTIGVARPTGQPAAPTKASGPTKATAAPARAPRTRRPAPAPRRVATGDGQSALDTIVANDQKTHGWLVKALYYQARAKAAGVSGPTAATDALDRQLAAVIGSYNARQQKIRNSTLVKASTGINETVKGWIERVKAMVPGLGGAGVGLLPALPLVPILVGVAAGAMAMGALWLLLRNDVAPSVNNLIAAARLTDAYGNMAPDGKELFEKTVTAAGEAGEQAGEDKADNSLFGQLKNNILLVGGGILAFTMLSKPKR